MVIFTCVDTNPKLHFLVFHMRDSEVLNRAQQTKCHCCNFPSMPITIANRKARHYHVGVTNSLNLVNCDLFNNWDLKQYREVKVSLKFPWYFLFDNSFWKRCHTQLFRSIPFWYRCKNFFQLIIKRLGFISNEIWNFSYCCPLLR